jgi:hypothetical protein
MLVMGIVMVRLAFGMRVQTGPHQYGNPPAGVALIFSGVSLLGISLVLLMKSPFRMPPGERLFRLVWLGPVGSAFVRFAGRSVKSGSPRRGKSLASRPAVRAVTPPAVAPPTNGSAPDRLRDLERRVDALERWRDER